MFWISGVLILFPKPDVCATPAWPFPETPTLPPFFCAMASAMNLDSVLSRKMVQWQF